MFKEIDHAIGVKDVATAKLIAGFCPEFTRVAYSAQLVGILTSLIVLWSTSGLDARQASLFINYTIASMTTLLDFEANRNCFVFLLYFDNDFSVDFDKGLFVSDLLKFAETILLHLD